MTEHERVQQIVERLKYAQDQRQWVQFQYKKDESEVKELRKIAVDRIHQAKKSGHWLVSAWSEERQAYRSFRISNMTEVRLLRDRVPEDVLT